MVRKRSRTSRKHYDDENDSDSDFALEEPCAQPAQKTYSLRQRKRRLFTEFEFDDDGDEIPPPKAHSDDEDFQVEKELELEEAAGTDYEERGTFISEIPDDSTSDGLIDFEDMIRADIVVNKNRIDYDNIIQKTEIKVQPVMEDVGSVHPVMKRRRGRKPKVRPEGEIDSSLLEPETEMYEAEFDDKQDKDYDPGDDIDNDEPIDCAQLMQAELSESAHELHSTPCIDEINNKPVQEPEGKIPVQVQVHEDKIQVPEQENRIVLGNGNGNDNGNSVDSSVKPSEGSMLYINPETGDLSEVMPEPTTDDESVPVKPEVVEIDDDDVVLVEDEKKCEVIVLDD